MEAIDGPLIDKSILFLKHVASRLTTSHASLTDLDQPKHLMGYSLQLVMDMVSSGDVFG